MKFIDLFAGTGAFSYVLQKHKFKCVFSNDMEKSSETIYKLNFPKCNYILNDLNKIDVNTIPSHDILCGGFPCQPFSIAGKQKGFDDERANVFWKIMSIVDKHNPQILILENVKNLLTHDNKKTFETITNEIKKRGYYIKYSILDTSKITTIPQHRERIYIICFKNKDSYNKFNFNFNFKNTNNLKINTFLEKNVNDKYYYTQKLKVYNLVKNEVTKNVNEHNVIYQYRRVYVRENKSNCCPTLTANMGSGGHNVPLIKDNNGIRKLTPRECFNLQGFPQDYKLPQNLSDSKLYKLAGNAVSVPVVDLIITNIKKTLSNNIVI